MIDKYISRLKIIGEHEIADYLQTLQKERDTAIEDLNAGICCETCIYADTDPNDQPCNTCRDAYAHGNWEWRGTTDGKQTERHTTI